MSGFLFYLFLPFFGFYCALLILLIYALPGRERKQAQTPPEACDTGITVILPFRNEAAVLRNTLKALDCQSFDINRWELLAVDDRSGDTGPDIVSGWIAERKLKGGHAELLRNESPGGKKLAIQTAVAASSFPICVVLDSDSQPGKNWLRTLLAQFDSKTGLLAAPVRFNGSGLFASLIQLEYAAILAAGMASFKLGRPLFASGANLAWRKQAFLDAGGYKGVHKLASGDDTILIQRIARRTDWRLKACFDSASIVDSRGPQNLRAFWQQRVRWTSTEFKMPDRMALLAALSMYLVYPLSLLILLSWLFSWTSEARLFGLVVAKLAVDLALLFKSASLFGLREQLLLTPLVWGAQLVYGSLVPWFGTFGSYKWREES